MTKVLQKALNSSSTARWTALIIVSVTMMFGYFITDVMSPLETILIDKYNWTSTEYGFYSGSYGFFNVFLLMLFFGGIILDRMGIRFTGLMATGLMLAGTVIQLYAVACTGGTFTAFGTEYNTQLMLASLGFALFGVGAEITGITVSKVIVKWFTGYELALAMGFQVALARLGTAGAMGFSLPIAKHFGDNVSYPLLIGTIALCISILSYLVYCVMDKKLDKSVKQAESSSSDEDQFKFADLKYIFTNKGFWLITILCLLFYAGVFPFLKFATKMMIFKYNVPEELAGYIPMLLPFGTIFLTPLFGTLYDKIGKGATLMIIGSAILTAVHVLFTLPILNVWWFAVIVMIVLGIAFSLVPSAMWPSVPKIIPMKQLGSAYAIIFYIQNIGLSLVPMLIGWIINEFSPITDASGNVTGYDYTIPMAVFSLFGLLAIGVALLLKHEDKIKNYGLEQANIQK